MGNDQARIAMSTPEEIEVEIGERIKALRLHNDLDQATVAERAGVSLTALKRLENGLGSTVNTLIRVLRALGQEASLHVFAPVPTINPLTMTRAAKPRQRASARRKKESRRGR